MQQNRMVVGRTALALAVGVMLGMATGAATAGTVKVKKDLTATSADANARGKTALNLLSGANGKFDVKASRLAPNASFAVVVRGVKVGTLQTGRSGSGKTRFSTHPGARDVALGFDPRGATVDIRDDNGDDVLVGDIPDDSVDPTEVACCLAQASSGESEVECEDMTSDACTAANGTPAGVASCLPDPCGGTTPVPESEIVCCTNETGDDESASECEDETEAECAAAGGMVVQATSCDPNPCAPTPPTTETACCVPNHDASSEIECEVTTPEACAALQGAAVAGGTCSTDPCGTGSEGSGS